MREVAPWVCGSWRRPKPKRAWHGSFGLLAWLLCLSQFRFPCSSFLAFRRALLDAELTACRKWDLAEAKWGGRGGPRLVFSGASRQSVAEAARKVM